MTPRTEPREAKPPKLDPILLRQGTVGQFEEELLLSGLVAQRFPLGQGLLPKGSIFWAGRVDLKLKVGSSDIGVRREITGQEIKSSHMESCQVRTIQDEFLQMWSVVSTQTHPVSPKPDLSFSA